MKLWEGNNVKVPYVNGIIPNSGCKVGYEPLERAPSPGEEGPSIFYLGDNSPQPSSRFRVEYSK